jgi:hypothetical protein
MVALVDSPNKPQLFSEAGTREQDRLEMYGGIGDIWRGYPGRRKTDGVNQQCVGVRREIVWLREQDSNLRPFGLQKLKLDLTVVE